MVLTIKPCVLPPTMNSCPHNIEGNCTVNMSVSATSVWFESADDVLTLEFKRSVNEIVRIDRVDETWVIITFTPEVQGDLDMLEWCDFSMLGALVRTWNFG
jgi:hypothetical protein